ncbi:tape measure protein [Rahnella aceris]|uniref:tape measure protein n=1 Tax=Rahnella sp. (strain Y9602) TaxID=2703885 RepID=UPI003BA04C3F
MAGNLDFFGLELNLNTAQVEKALARIEARVAKSAAKLEKQLNAAFSKNTGAASMNRLFDAIDKRATKSGQHIRKEMNNAFSGVGGAARGGFRNAEVEATAFTGRLRGMMRDAMTIPRANLRGQGFGAGARPAGGSGGGSRPRLSEAATLANNQRRLSEFISRQSQSASMARWSVRDPERYARRADELNQIRDRHMSSGNLSGAVRDVRSSMFQHRQELAGVTRSVTGSMNSFGGGLMELVGKLYLMQKAAELFLATLHTGVARQGAENRLSSAFGADTNNVRRQVEILSNEFGANFTEQMQDASTLRATIPRDKVSDATILSLLKEETVAKVPFGLTPDALKRVNNAFSQIMSAGKLLGQDANQLKDSFPEWTRIVSKGLGRNVSRKDLLGMDSEKLFAAFIDGLKKSNEEMDAYNKARNAMSTKLMQTENANQALQNSVFNGYQKGFGEFLTSITDLMTAFAPEGQEFGTVLGRMFSGIAAFVEEVASAVLSFNGQVAEWRIAFRSWDDNTKNIVRAAASIGEGIGGLALALGAAWVTLKPIISAVGMIRGLGAAASGTTAAEVAGAAGGGSVAGVIGALTLPAGAVLAAKQGSKRLTPEQRAGLNTISETAMGGSANLLEQGQDYDKLLNPNNANVGAKGTFWKDLVSGAVEHFNNFLSAPSSMTSLMPASSKNGFSYTPNVSLLNKDLAVNTGALYAQQQRQMVQAPVNSSLRLDITQNGVALQSFMFDALNQRDERITINALPLEGSASSDNAGWRNPYALSPTAPSASR